MTPQASTILRVTVAVLLSSVAGCANTPPDYAAGWEASLPPDVPMSAAGNGAIYQAGQDVRLFENTVARRIGDTSAG